MAGDWMKIEKGLAKKPKVLRISRRLGVDRRIVAMALIELWSWADDVSVDGRVDGVELPDIDDIAELPGLADEMVDVGWLSVDNSAGVVVFPKFDTHNTETAKQRALKAARQRRYRRNGGSCVDGDVDGRVDGPTPRDRTPENRTGQKTTSSLPPPSESEARQAGGGQTLRVEEIELRDPESLVNRLLHAGHVGLDDGERTLRLAVYALAEGRHPAGLFVARLRAREWVPDDWEPAKPADYRAPPKSEPVPDSVLERVEGGRELVEERRLSAAEPALDPNEVSQRAREYLAQRPASEPKEEPAPATPDREAGW